MQYSKVLGVGNVFIAHPCLPEKKNEWAEKCLTSGLCWAYDRAVIRLLIPADVRSAHAVPAWH